MLLTISTHNVWNMMLFYRGGYKDTIFRTLYTEFVLSVNGSVKPYSIDVNAGNEQDVRFESEFYTAYSATWWINIVIALLNIIIMGFN